MYDSIQQCQCMQGMLLVNALWFSCLSKIKKSNKRYIFIKNKLITDCLTAYMPPSWDGIILSLFYLPARVGQWDNLTRFCNLDWLLTPRSAKVQAKLEIARNIDLTNVTLLRFHRPRNSTISQPCRKSIPGLKNSRLNLYYNSSNRYFANAGKLNMLVSWYWHV